MKERARAHTHTHTVLISLSHIGGIDQWRRTISGQPPAARQMPCERSRLCLVASLSLSRSLARFLFSVSVSPVCLSLQVCCHPYDCPSVSALPVCLPPSLPAFLPPYLLRCPCLFLSFCLPLFLTLSVSLPPPSVLPASDCPSVPVLV